jgi:uncharacterized protein YegL
LKICISDIAQNVRRKGGMSRKRGLFRLRKFFTLSVSVNLLIGIMLIGMTIDFPTAKGGAVTHSVGELQIQSLTDFGRVFLPLKWPKTGTLQTTHDPQTGLGFIGLVVDQDNYDHNPPSLDIADSYDYFPYLVTDDFVTIRPAEMVLDDGTTQKSIASYQNMGTTIDANDIQINQTVWTVKDKDWALLQFRVINLKSVSITGFNLGLEIPISQVGAGYGLGGDSGDDIDGFDSQDNIYWAQDDGGTTIGFASAITQSPITHYYSEDYHPANYDEYKVFWENENWLYDRLSAPNKTVGSIPGNRTSTVGWKDVTIGIGSSETFTLVIAINGSFNDMKSAISDAQYFYSNEASGFRITEFSDSDSDPQHIEVYNFGREQTDLVNSGYFLSVNGGVTPLLGNWNNNPLPTYEYSVFKLNPGEEIGFEGGTIGLYQNLGGGNSVLLDSVSFGSNGVAPDPLLDESTARVWDESIVEYNNDWVRASTSTFGAQNNVPSVDTEPNVVLNEVMFYPSVFDGGYVTIYNNGVTIINVRDYYIVCDTVYQLSGFGDIWLAPQSTFIVKYSDNTGSLLDMVGWNSQHLQGMSIRRTPDGYGTYQGYNDAMSEAAGWVFNTPQGILITEIADSGSIQAKIEVYNPRYPPMDLSVGHSFASDSGPLLGTWSVSIVDSGEYGIFDVTTPNGLSFEGDTIRLYQMGVLIEQVSYGQNGMIPDPLSGESVQRYWNGTVYTDDWERNYTTGSNFGIQNDVPPKNITSRVKLNEILFNPSSPSDGFVELYLLFGNLDISGYKVVGDLEYIIPSGTQLSYDDRYFYLRYSDYPAFFNELNPSGDNVYLYDSNGSFVDMAGWNSAHTRGKSMTRDPPGSGARDGFDDPSSVSAGWVFDSPPSIQMIALDTDDPVKYGAFGGTVKYNLTIENKQSSDDTVLITNTTINGYPVFIMDKSGTFVISDINVPAGSSVNFTVLVILPSTVPLENHDNITIIIQSLNDILYRDSLILRALVTPFIWPEKDISPKQIYYHGTGHDEITTITLNITGYGHVIELFQPQDVIFCVDTSGSMTPMAIGMIIEGLLGYVDEMRSSDFGAVVVFNSGAWLLNPLTNNHTQLRNDINSIPGPNGATYMGEALAVAIDEILSNGNQSHIQVVILLTDGGWNGMMDPIVQADRAALYNIMIFTIGLEPIPPYNLDEGTLINIADRTGGEYFYAEDASQIPEIYKIIARYIGDIAGRDMDILDANPMIRDVLLPWIVLVEDSFSIWPDINYVNETGYRILEWNLSSLFVGESWEVTFQVKSTRLGQVHTNDVSASRISYVDYFDNEYIRIFPECIANVLPPVPYPPKLYIDTSLDKNDIFLYWEKPISPGTDHYLIYRAATPIGFDFSQPWIDTSQDIDPKDPGPVPPPVGLRLSWNHTNAQDPATPQFYYCIRSVNTLGEISSTSRTVGKWTVSFSQGVSTFSLPLEPLETMDKNTDFYLGDMNARYIKWMNPISHKWMKHGEGEVNDALLEVGSGYVVAFDSATTYTFLGMPGAMIRYTTHWFLGFDYATGAKSLIASVNPVTGDVTLNWDEPLVRDSNGGYNVIYSTTRDGFSDGSTTLLAFVPASSPRMAIHSGATSFPSQYFYMVVPVNESGYEGASTYSVAVITSGYDAEYDTMGIPVVQSSDQTADWFCSEIDDAVGINYLADSNGRWSWHSERMEKGAYDPEIVMTEGYQISTVTQTKYTFIGY